MTSSLRTSLSSAVKKRHESGDHAFTGGRTSECPHSQTFLLLIQLNANLEIG